MKISRPNKREIRQAAIVDIARDAFFRFGFAGTTMSWIAAQAGGSKSTLWAHFSNKQALFTAVLDDLIARYAAAVMVPLPAGGAIRATLHHMASAIVQASLEPHIIALYRLVVGEADRFPELGQLFHERGPGRGQARLAAWLEQAMAAGQLRRADPMVAAQHFGALCQAGIFQRRLYGVGPVPGAAEIETEIQAALNSFIAAYAPLSD